MGSCACSNSETCKTHSHSAGDTEHTGSAPRAGTCIWLLGPILKRPLHKRWGASREMATTPGGEWERKARTRMHTRGRLRRLPASSRFPALSTCLAQNFSSCGLLTNYIFFSPLKAQTYLQFSDIFFQVLRPILSKLLAGWCTAASWSFSAVCVAGQQLLTWSSQKMRAFFLCHCGVWASLPPTMKVGPQERPKWQKHDQNRGHLKFFSLHLTYP